MTTGIPVSWCPPGDVMGWQHVNWSPHGDKKLEVDHEVIYVAQLMVIDREVTHAVQSESELGRAVIHMAQLESEHDRDAVFQTKLMVMTYTRAQVDSQGHGTR